MYRYIETRIMSVLKILYDNLEYNFKSQILSNTEKKDEGYILISAEDVFNTNEQDLLIVVTKEHLRLHIPDLFILEGPDYEFLNEINFYCDYTKFTMDDHNNVSAENFFYTGQFIVDMAPMLLIINFKRFVKEIDELLEKFTDAKKRPRDKSMESTITIAKAAEILGVSKSTVTNWVSSGYIEAEKIKGKWMINNDSLKTFKVQWDSRFSEGTEFN